MRTATWNDRTEVNCLIATMRDAGVDDPREALNQLLDTRDPITFKSGILSWNESTNQYVWTQIYLTSQLYDSYIESVMSSYGRHSVETNVAFEEWKLAQCDYCFLSRHKCRLYVAFGYMPCCSECTHHAQ